jgi:hypothetical protein
VSSQCKDVKSVSKLELMAAEPSARIVNSHAACTMNKIVI